MSGQPSVTDSLSKLDINDELNNLNEIHKNRKKTNKTLLTKQFNDIINKKMLVNNPNEVLDILLYISDRKIFLSLLRNNESLTYIKLLKSFLKENNSENLTEALSLLNLLVLNFKYKYEDISFVVPYISPLIGEHTKIVELTLLKLSLDSKTALTKDLQEQFETLADLQLIYPALCLLLFIFKLDPSLGKEIFQSQVCVEIIKQINVNSKKDLIIVSLELLNFVCGFKDLHSKVYGDYFPYLKLGLQNKFIEIKLLACVILAKLWINQPNLETFKLEEILPFLLENLANEHAIEALANLSLNISVKKLMRQDDEFIFDLTKMIEQPHINNMYGILMILTNLSTLPPDENDNSDLARMKRFSKSGLNQEKDDTRDTIQKFNGDLVERKLVKLLSNISLKSKNLQTVILDLLINISDNNNKEVVISCVKQGMFTICLKLLQKPSSLNVKAFRIIVSQAFQINPTILSNSIHELISYIASYLAMDSEELTLKDKYKALLSLTNFASIDGYFPENLWPIIDFYMNSEHIFLQESTFQLVSNLSSFEQNFVKFFNGENPVSVKRLNIVVDGIQSGNGDILCSSLAILANGSAVPFIALYIVEKYPDLIAMLVSILEQNLVFASVVHRILTFFLNITYSSKEWCFALKNDQDFRKGLDRVNAIYRTNEDILEILKKIRVSISHVE